MHSITFTTSTDARHPVSLCHPGPIDAACDYFHGEVGPAYPVILDGKAGSFTANADATHKDGDVRFVEDHSVQSGPEAHLAFIIHGHGRDAD
jgi:hypothetical protein